MVTCKEVLERLCNMHLVKEILLQLELFGEKLTSSPITLDSIGKFLPITGRASRVNGNDKVTLGGKQSRVPAS